MGNELDVYGIGNPLVDLSFQVTESKIEELGMTKGVMNLIDTEKRNFILNNISDPDIGLGGSCANTIISMSDYGLNVAYSGGVGPDIYATEIEKGLLDLNVNSNLKEKNLPTGSSIIFVTPDSDRTLNTYLGACQQYSKEDIDEDLIEKSNSIYFTGYMWDTQNQKTALKHAINVAKDAGTKVFFDLADPFAVNRSKNDFIELLKNDVDFALVNEEEVKSLTNNTNIEDAINDFRSLIDFGAIKLGENGSKVFQDGKMIDIPVYNTDAIDTTGAGDIYAAGIIYGITKGFSLEKSGKLASFVASKVVEKIGARVDYSLKSEIKDFE